MRTTQQKFLDLAAAIAEEAEVEAIVDLRFGNEGTVKFQPRDSLRSRLIVKFSFQESGTSLEATPRIEGKSGWDAYTGQFWAPDSAKLDQALTDIAEFLGVTR